MLKKYFIVMKIAFRHEDFLKEEMENFQGKVNEGFYHYVKPAITNYMDLLGASEMEKYWQPSWDMKNSAVASFMI
jgi:hypothetical protein